MAAGNVPQFASLYVGDLHPEVTEASLYEIFNSVGPVGSIRICRDSVSRASLGYGYVNFHSVQDAERALDTLNYSSIKGRACRIMWSQRDPSLRKSGLGNIFVKNLDTNIDNKALYDTFSLFGNILSCKVACDSQSGKSHGYGFVHYETDEAAKQAIARVNGMKIGDKMVEVHCFKKRDERDSDGAFTNVFAKNIPEDFDDEKLKELFGPFGTVTSHIVREDAQGRKYCFVNFEEPEQAKKAIDELNGKDMRSDEQKAATKEDADPESYLVYVGRALNKQERIQEWKQKNASTGAGKSQQVSGVNLYVKNLDENTTDESLKELFQSYGTITSCVATKDDKEKCKGFGFVCFSTPDEATKAVTEMHLKVVKGKPLYVGLAEKKEARQERLRQRYQPGPGGMGKGGKDGGKGGKNGGGGNGPMGQQGMMGGGMMGGGMMGGPQMMGMMGGGKGMCGPMQMMGGGKGMMGPGGKGPQMMGMMGGPQMMGARPGMVPPQMLNMMGGKGGPMGGVPGNMGGMMRPMMPMMQGQRMPMPQQPGQAQMRPPMQPGQNITATSLASAPPSAQKQMLGEKLYPAIQKHQPDLAGKITGMMLEMDNSELLILLESDAQLKQKVDEAMQVLSGNRARA